MWWSSLLFFGAGVTWGPNVTSTNPPWPSSAPAGKGDGQGFGRGRRVMPRSFMGWPIFWPALQLEVQVCGLVCDGGMAPHDVNLRILGRGTQGQHALHFHGQSECHGAIAQLKSIVIRAIEFPLLIGRIFIECPPPAINHCLMHADTIIFLTCRYSYYSSLADAMRCFFLLMEELSAYICLLIIELFQPPFYLRITITSLTIYFQITTLAGTNRGHLPRWESLWVWAKRGSPCSLTVGLICMTTTFSWNVCVPYTLCAFVWPL